MKWNKTVSILCVAAMTLGMLTGCGGGVRRGRDSGGIGCR